MNEISGENYSEMTNDQYKKEIYLIISDVENNRLLQYLHRYITGKVSKFSQG